MPRGWLACLWLVAPGAAAAGPNPWAQPPVAGPAQTTPGPAPEVSGNTATLTLPAVPAFAVPSFPGGLHGPRELLIAGDRLHGTRVTVGGYITWIYDCVTQVSHLGRTRAQIQKRIDADPTLCERPKFTLGDTPDAPADRSLWIVDVPRPPNALERRHLPPSELAHWPAVPRLTRGAYVEVTGTLAVRSPHNEANSDGLIVYEAIDTSKTAPPVQTLTASPEVPLPAAPAAPVPAGTALPASAGDSLRHANAGHRAYASKQYDTAIAEYDAAIRIWNGNHLAWYGLAGARAQRGDYRAAAEAAGRCVALVPDQAMYWLLRGSMLHEAAIRDARDREARVQGRRADEVVIDRAALDLTPALEALVRATQLEGQLWRAHYLTGRILRDRGDARAAALALSRAIAAHAWEPAPYVALVELYRRWRYRDAALAIAVVGAASVPSSAEIWFELGMAHDDRGERAEAIAAFTKALDVKPNLAVARLQRGQAYVRIHDVARGRRDLEAFVKAGGASFEIEQAKHLLASLER